MTDSRVTPEAIEAAAAAITEYPMVDDVDRAYARAALAAAVPLLCQPLQDEIDRLRAVLAELPGQIEREKTAFFPGGDPDRERLIHAAFNHAAWICRHAAAVPVGTGNPDGKTQQ